MVYEAPTPGKLPHKLYKSIEMISQFDKSDCSCSNSLDCYSLLQGNNFSTVCSVPEVKLFFQRITAPKSGVVRTTEYTKDGNNVAVDELARFSSHVRILRGLELAQSPLLHKTPTSQLPFIETENASEGIRQLLYSQQHLNTGEHDSMIGRNPVSQLQKRKHKLSKPQVVVDGKDFELDCELCKRSENASFQTSHIPSWTDNWNSLSSEENFSIVYNQQHPS